jgi:exonuclease SbcC
VRLHKLVIENLNSLYGEQTIDFDGELGEAGLFLIQGPTGSGKSTVLDAICLALFGLTPRLREPASKAIDGDPEGAGEGDPARIMSRGTGACSAVLELSLRNPEGRLVRYRAGWRTWRSREKADGIFQSPVRSLEELVDGAWVKRVDSKNLKDWKGPFQAMLQGLSFDDFQRTAMLAQFAFREFLEASDTDRARLLERMTATGQFRAIGQAAARAKSDAKATVERIEAEIGASAVLEDAARAAHVAELAAAKDAAAKAKAFAEALGAAAAYWVAFERGQKDVADAEGALADVAKQRAAAGADLDALVEDERVAPAMAALVEWRGRAQAEANAGAARDAKANERDAMSGPRDDARTQSEAASNTRAAEERTRADAAPAIAAAGAAWGQAELAADVARRAEEELGTRLSRRDTTRQAALDAADGERVVANDANAVVAAIEAIPAHAMLVEQVAGISAQADALTRAREQHARAAALATDRAAEGDVHARGRSELVSAKQSTDGAAAARADLRAAADDALRAIAGDASLDDARNALDLQREAAQVVLAAHGSLEQELSALATHEGESATQSARCDAANEAAHVARTSLAALAEEREKLQREASVRAEHRDTLKELLGVIAHRGALRADEACPVCGSETHPYREHPERAPKHEEVARRLAHLEEEIRAAEASLRALDDRAAKTHADEATQTQAAKDASDRLDRARTAYQEVEARALAHAATAGVAVDASAEQRAVARTAADATLQAAIRQREALDRCGKALRDADAAAALARDAATTAAQALDKHDLEARSLAGSIDQLGKQRDELASQVRAACVTLTEALARVDITCDANDVDAVAQGAIVANARAVELRALLERRGAIEPRRALAERTRLNADADATNAETQLQEAQIARDLKAAASQAALEAARAHLDGRRPDAVQAELDAAVAAASEAERVAMRIFAAIDADWSAAGAALAQLDVLRIDAGERAASARRELDAQIAALGLATEEEAEARSLSTEVRARVCELRGELDSAETAAKARIDEARRSLGEQGALRPASEPADAVPADRVQALTVLRGEAETARTQGEQRVGELTRVLDSDDAARLQRAGRQASLDAAREDLDRWTEIHELIGVRDGDAFVKVVQSLNLGSVLGRANDQLARFMPRYSLQQIVHKTDGPLLDFRVVDRFQQDGARTIRSLSGGESFIVSLALALGLAATRASSLRIETLLIDEGFGSLDPATLAQALAALSSLQSALGVRIGVISHVEALRETIPAQIVVAPVGSGRSTVKVARTRV